MVATTDRRCCIKCLHAHFRGDFVFVGANSGGQFKLSGGYFI